MLWLYLASLVESVSQIEAQHSVCILSADVYKCPIKQIVNDMQQALEVGPVFRDMIISPGFINMDV